MDESNLSSDASETTPHIIFNPQFTTEIISVGITERSDQNLFSFLTVPTRSRIQSIQPQNNEGKVIHPQTQVISVCGTSKGTNIREDLELQPGDYCLVLSFDSKETAERILSLTIQMQILPVTNFQISQIMFGLYRSLGFEPGQVLKYPFRSQSNSAIPFYRKTRSEISELQREVQKVSSEVQDRLQVLDDKLSSEVQDRLQVLDDKLSSEVQDRLQVLDDKLSSQDRTELASKKEPSQSTPEDKTETPEDKREEVSSLKRLLEDNSARLKEHKTLLQEIQKSLLSLQESSPKSSSSPEEITITVEQIEDMKVRLETIQNSLHGDRESSQTITIAELQKVLDERKSFYEKLAEAEDYIELLEEKKSGHH